MLGQLQERLHRLYDLDVDARVEDFVCDLELARDAARDAAERGEVLVVVEHPPHASVGLYVDPAALERLRTRPAWWRGPDGFRAFCLAAEGVSHFVYLMFRASREESVSQLELEIQAEVDKYVTALLDPGHAGPALRTSRALRRRLYDGVRFHDGPEGQAGRRYRLANRVAARFVGHLEHRYVSPGDLEGLSRELRRFYRLGGQGKLAALPGR